MKDTLNRPLRDLRLSVTDRCNFRCTYCMPKEIFGRDHIFMPRSELLSFEEIHRTASIFVNLGVRKIRITGGEPLLRKDIDKLGMEIIGIIHSRLAFSASVLVTLVLAAALGVIFESTFYCRAFDAFKPSHDHESLFSTPNYPPFIGSGGHC